jgi:hypothetical protein
VINQLCRQSSNISAKVRELHHDGDEPTVASLLVALSDVLDNFDRVYLVLDALDECHNRPNLLNTLVNIATNNAFTKIQILALSRKEPEIERATTGIFAVISLSNNRWVDEDIRAYIQSHISQDRKLNRWPQSLKDEIEAALMKGAKGMYVLQSSEFIIAPY